MNILFILQIKADEEEEVGQQSGVKVRGWVLKCCSVNN